MRQSDAVSIIAGQSSNTAMNRPHFQTSEHSTKFFGTLRERVNALLPSETLCAPAPWQFWLKATTWFVIAVLAYVLLVTSSGSLVLMLGGAAAYGLSSLLLAFNIGHDASHQTVTRIPWLDHLLHRVVFIPVGIDATLWRLRHLRSHNVFTNVDAVTSTLLRTHSSDCHRTHRGIGASVGSIGMRPSFICA